MADGISTVALPLVTGATGLGIASMFPGLDLSAVIGAFGGAFCFVLFAKDINGWQRAGYLVVGWIGGYLIGQELMARGVGLTLGALTFVAGLLCVVISVSAIESVQTGKWPTWMQSAWGWFRGIKRST